MAQLRNASTEAPKGTALADKPDAQGNAEAQARLVSLYKDVTEGGAMLPTVPPAYKNAIADTLGRNWQAATDALQHWTALIDQVGLAIGASRKADQLVGEQLIHAFRVVPAIDAATLAALVYTGKRPTSPCGHVVCMECAPSGGIAIDRVLSEAATATASDLLSKLPVPAMVLVAPTLPASLINKPKDNGIKGTKNGGLRGQGAMAAVFSAVGDQTFTWKVPGTDRRVSAQFHREGESVVLTAEDGTVYADPSAFCDGEKRKVSGDNPNGKDGRWSFNGWREVTYAGKEAGELARKSLGDN